MRKRIAALLIALIILRPLNVCAAESTEAIKQETTAYCMGHTTASGTPVRYGVAAVNRARMGMTAIVYERTPDGPGAILGYFECEDTGKGGDADGDGIGAIQEGKVIDIYFPTLEECTAWMKLTGGKVYVQYVEAKG